MGKRVLITGGSGFLGINLCRYLHAKGYNINVIDIAPFEYRDMHGKISFYHGDIRDKKMLESAMQGCEFVVHAAAALPLYSKEEIFSVDIDGTRQVLDTSVKYGIKRFIHISSTAVYGIPEKHPLTEDDRLVGVGAYGEAKIEAERLCESYRKKGLIVPILRPKSFVGPERLGVFAIYFDWISRDKSIPIVGNGRNRYQLLDVEDLCEAIRLCIELPKSKVDDVFNIGAKEFTTMKEDFGAVIKFRGSGKRIVPVPAAPLILLLRFLEFLHISPLYRWVYETAPKDSFVSIERAEKKLGFKPRFSNKEALIRNYQWYLKNCKTFDNETGVTHRLPWKQGILKFVSWFF